MIAQNSAFEIDQLVDIVIYLDTLLLSLFFFKCVTGVCCLLFQISLRFESSGVLQNSIQILKVQYKF